MTGPYAEALDRRTHSDRREESDESVWLICKHFDRKLRFKSPGKLGFSGVARRVGCRKPEWL